MLSARQKRLRYQNICGKPVNDNRCAAKFGPWVVSAAAIPEQTSEVEFGGAPPSAISTGLELIAGVFVALLGLLLWAGAVHTVLWLGHI